MSVVGGIGPALLAVLWTLVGLATILMALRTYAASLRSGKVRWDFAWIALSYFTALAGAIFIHIGVLNGLGNRISHLQAQQIWDSFFWFYMAVYLGTASIAFSKFAVIALLLDVYKGSRATKRKWALWAIGILFAVSTLLETFFTAFQCQPTKKVWDLTVQGTCAYAGAAKVSSYIHAATGAVTDIMLALWPISIVWRLNASLRIKTSICVLMGLGIIPGIAAFVRIELLYRLHHSRDPTYDSGLFLLSATIETGLLIIVGCIPPLRLLFSRFFKAATVAVSRGPTQASIARSTQRDNQSKITPYKSGHIFKCEGSGKITANVSVQSLLVETSYRIEPVGATPTSKANMFELASV